MRVNLLAGVGLSALLGCGGNNNTDEPVETVRRYEGIITVVAVNSSEGDVTLEGTDTRIVEARFTPSSDGDNFQGQLSSNGRLSLGSVCQDGQLGCGTNIDVTMPNNIEFEVDTQRGNIMLDGLGFGGEVRSVVGTVTAVDLGQVDLEVTTQNAAQDLEFRLQPVRVSMDGGATGNLTIRLPPGDYQFDIATNGRLVFESGEVRDAEFGPEIQMNTGTGEVIVDRN